MLVSESFGARTAMTTTEMTDVRIRALLNQLVPLAMLSSLMENNLLMIGFGSFWSPLNLQICNFGNIQVESIYLNDRIYRMVKERYSNISLNQTIVSDQSELTILLCQLMNSLILMKTTLPWYSGLQLLPSYIWSLSNSHIIRIYRV